MKKLLAIFSLVCFFAAGIVYADVFEWDFSKGISPTGGNMEFTLSNSSELKDGALYAKEIARNKFSGIISKQIYPQLTPQGSFRISFVISFEPPRSKEAYLILWDSKADYYEKGTGKAVDNSGFTLALRQAGKGTVMTPQAWLGFGTKTATLTGKPFRPSVGKKYTFEFYYNGSGLAEFYVNGKLNSEISVEPGGPLSPAHFKAGIGNRVVGNYSGFDGKIYSVKIVTGKAEHLNIRAVGRKVFRRGEKNAALQVEIRNVSRQKESGLNPGEKKIEKIPVNTDLTIGVYPVKYSFGGKDFSFQYEIAPVVHDRMHIVMWGFGDDHRILQKSGFTHQLGSLASGFYMRPGENNKDFSIDRLDDILRTGFYFSDYYTLPHYNQAIKKYPRMNRAGKPALRGKRLALDANNPQAVKDFTEWADKISASFEGHPALTMLDICSEIRDATVPSFTVHERNACKKATGADIPELVNGKSISYNVIPDFPKSRIIPDDYPYLKYYAWFWKDGDGWNPLFSKISDAYRKNLQPEFKTYFAPACRQPPIRGIGGNSDFLGQWTYPNPEPQILAASADELIAIAGGKPVIQGTQLILYRSAAAPIWMKIKSPPAWVAKEPKARYISVPPDALVQAIWATLTRPVHGMIFHGDGSFYPAPVRGTEMYRMTNEKAEPAFRKVMEEVVTPLGATLREIKGEKSKVAILHSFASSVLAGRGSHGWVGWLMNLHIALQCGGLDPRVIYEEDITNGELKDVKILVLSHCDILPEGVYRRIKEFQVKGGIVVADETVPFALLPNVRFQTKRFSGDALENKAEIVKLGLQIRNDLGKYYEPLSETSSPDLISKLRDEYLFVINDKRTFGDYLGPWKRFAEKALPNSGTVTANKKAVAVYDLVARKAVSFRIVKGKTAIDVAINGAGGKLFLLLDQPLKPVSLRVKPNGEVSADLGTKVTIPVQLIVRDANGKETDDTHYAPAVNGKFSYKINVPENAAKGSWSVELVRIPDHAVTKGALTVK